MCVIYACGSKLPPEEELARGAFKNDDGAGICWINQAKNRVEWMKGLKDEKDVLKAIQEAKIPFPLAIHFRTASAGGVSPELCHPFPVTEDVPLWLEGSAPQVLMHNGHLTNWEELVLRAAFGSPAQVPDGDWSDSRALAYLTALKGTGVLRFIHQSSRVLTLSAEPDWEPQYEGDPWVNFSFWGSWVGKREDGFIQSIGTEYYNRGGSVSATRGAACYDYTMDPDDSTPTTGITRCTSPVLSPQNVWTVGELSALLVDMEKELEDARTAARA